MPSRLAPISHEAVATEKRIALSLGVKFAAIFRTARCRCGARFLEAGVEYDHEIPLALGGKNDAANIVALCPSCHRRKSSADMKAIAKMRRIRGETGRHKPGARIAKINSRGFDKLLRKRMNGQVERRT